ncbi:MAG: hypothetical protein ABIK08_11205 [Pseudomonadota bacterium]
MEMTEAEKHAYSHAVSVCEKAVENFAADYVRKWGGTQDAKAHGWAILMAAAELRKCYPPAELVHNVELTGAARHERETKP